VIHVFGDGHTSSFTEDVDPVFYLSLVSRSSNEPLIGEY